MNFLKPQSLPCTNLQRIKKSNRLRKIHNYSKSINQPVCSLTLHRLCLLPLGIENAEFELCSNFTFVAGDQEEVEGEVVLRLLVQALRVDPQTPLELVVLPGREGGGLEHLAHLLAAEGEVGDGPHVGELDHLDLGVAPVLCHGGSCIVGGRCRHPE